MSSMKRYKVTFSHPDPSSAEPAFVVHVEAPDEEIALEQAFDDAFYYFPQFDTFKCEEIAEEAQ